MEVHAAAGGRLKVEVANCWVSITHSDGWQTRYYHLKNIDTSLNNTDVAIGKRFATAGQAQLGGNLWFSTKTPNFRHVHFALAHNGSLVLLDGTSIGGYTVHQTGSAYCGYWTRDSDGVVVADARRTCQAVPSLVNNQSSNPPPVDPPSSHNPDGFLDHCHTFGPRSSVGRMGKRPRQWLGRYPSSGACGRQQCRSGNCGQLSVRCRCPWIRLYGPGGATTPTRCALRALNIGGGNHVVLPGCVQVPASNRPPVGNLDSVVRIDGGHVRLAGWAKDPDTSSPIQVQGLIDNNNVGAVNASNTRQDVGPHGFNFIVPTDWRAHTACVRAIDSAGGPNTVLNGCAPSPSLIARTRHRP